MFFFVLTMLCKLNYTLGLCKQCVDYVAPRRSRAVGLWLSYSRSSWAQKSNSLRRRFQKRWSNYHWLLGGKDIFITVWYQYTNIYTFFVICHMTKYHQIFICRYWMIIVQSCKRSFCFLQLVVIEFRLEAWEKWRSKLPGLRY